MLANNKNIIGMLINKLSRTIEIFMLINTLMYDLKQLSILSLMYTRYAS